ncbi:oxidoreductase [Parapedobacter sp. ISTM3]|uniref:WD40/YVTN/BNR-like repeat-containing protein n=1 Tax=Parapedobacter sp. ISTM3 TaxID=2800130 RepID=UPI00190876B4|nr:YCF48-related protein [Parapedobacter sp. ISTM3]MBK1439059.1 oxidoreductase [Parapedobacter sp. ISTM3]
MKWLLGIISSCAVVLSAYGQGAQIAMLEGGKPTSIRGLSVLDDSVAWVSGSAGWVSRTTDGGRTWRWQQVAGHEATDFRDIEVFSGLEAIIISAGSPLVILRTTDGGTTWQETYRDERHEIFFDGMDFWDNGRGLAYGDPIDGVMQLLATEDRGKTWQDISEQADVRLGDGEAGFAASGTGIRTLSAGHAFIGTGGSHARLLHSADHGNTWRAYGCPIIQGSASTGIFSVAFRDERHGVVVGGDYQADRSTDSVVFVTADGGATWQQPTVGTHGFRSAAEYVGARDLVAVGTSGVDISSDGGMTWNAVSKESFHVVRQAKAGTWVVLAGANGRIASLQMNF